MTTTLYLFLSPHPTFSANRWQEKKNVGKKKEKERDTSQQFTASRSLFRGQTR